MKVSELRLPIQRGDRGEQVQVVQRALGISADGDFGPRTENAVRVFQNSKGLGVDGVVGPLTATALDGAAAVRGYPEPGPGPAVSGVARPVTTDSAPVVLQAVRGPVIPFPLKPLSSGYVIDRLVMHWTAGNGKSSAFDRLHYHIVIDTDGTILKGTPSVPANARPMPTSAMFGLRASHTLNCNTGSAAVSLAGMGNAVEYPFNPGKWPITRKQFDLLPLVVAELFKFYNINRGVVTRKSCLSHAEVQGELGIKQRGKWDINRLPSDCLPPDFTQSGTLIGDYVRRRVIARLSQL
jgi:hypothetical protein